MIAKIVGIGAALTLSGWLYVLTWQMAELLATADRLIAAHIRCAEPEPDVSTDEFPAVPATQPDGIAVQVQDALLKARPTPHPTVSRDIGGRTFMFREDV